MTSIINKPDQILYAENETPSLGITILLAVTHVALIFDAVVFLFAYFFRFFRHIVTPAVGGIVIILVAVNLIPIGLELHHFHVSPLFGFPTIA